jgi:hypothetical protein
MQFFCKKGKFNWVDDNNAFVGYNSEQSCCEYFGWIYLDVECPITNPSFAENMYEEHTLEGYVFDTDYVKLYWCDDVDDVTWYPLETEVTSFHGQPYVETVKEESKEGNTVVFKLVHPTLLPKYLALQNFQNSYYGHGFSMKVNETMKYQGVL